MYYKLLLDHASLRKTSRDALRSLPIEIFTFCVFCVAGAVAAARRGRRVSGEWFDIAGPEMLTAIGYPLPVSKELGKGGTSFAEGCPRPRNSACDPVHGPRAEGWGPSVAGAVGEGAGVRLNWDRSD